MRLTYIFIFSFLFTILNAQEAPETLKYSSVNVDTLLIGDYSIRAITIDGSTLHYGADKSRIGSINIATKDFKEYQYDQSNIEFRSIAHNRTDIFALSAGTPAVLTRINKNDGNMKVEYDDYNPDIFYDSMQFWSEYEGIAFGDPMRGCMTIIITRDGGKKWRRVPCSIVPYPKEGEGGFAASNTNIVTKGDRTYIATGGSVSRILYSPDKGRKWGVIDTPIISGTATQGIYSMDFYDFKYGFITGGDYLKPDDNKANKALTTDGGKTWKLVADGEAFGYASCVQFIPDSDGKALVTVGPSGLYYSADYGHTWKVLLKDTSLNTIRFQNPRTAFAAGKGKIIKITFK